MARKRQAWLGAALLLLSLTAPFVVRISGPFEGSRLPSILLELRSLDSALTADALLLRIGVQGNYDSLEARRAAIESDARDFLANAAPLAEPARTRLVRSFAAFQGLMQTRAEALERFPEDNATLNNSLRLLTATYARAHARLTATPVEGLAQEIDTLHTRTLEFYVSSEPTGREALIDDLDRATARPTVAGPVRAMLEHARVVVVQRDLVEQDVRRLVNSSGEKVLLATFDLLQEEAKAAIERTDRLRAVLSGLCVLGAVITCAAGGLAVLRQNKVLEREIKEAVERAIEERERADQEAHKLEAELRHAQKLEAVGQLAAGIAHEINTPTQYVSDNTTFLRDSFGQVLDAFTRCRELLSTGDGDPALLEALAKLDQELDLAYLRDEIPRALDESLDGLGRIGSIVKAMKSFSHPSNGQITHADLNAAIQSTVTVARNEWKYVAQLELDLDPKLPPVPCILDEFNQVVLNILVNAAHAIASGLKAPGTVPGTLGKIRISTRVAGDRAEVRIQDSGSGIPAAVLPRIFDPFFTTKEVGKGTGQGLAIAHDVIVVKHGGTIDVETEPGKGTTFIVRLPLEHATAPRPAA